MRAWHGAIAVWGVIGMACPALAQPTPEQKPTIKDRVDAVVATVTLDPLARADTDMKHVLDALKSLNPKPIDSLSATEARQQPGAADAVKALLKREGRSTAPMPGVTARDIQVEGGAGPIPARVYTPDHNDPSKPLPIVVYFHGGGFVIATVDTYDSSARAMAAMANAIVVAVEYRKAPENKAFSAHDDAFAAYKWVLANASSFNGNAKRVAVMGESAGGNLAINVSIAARDAKIQAPLRQVLIYPVAGIDTNTQSYKDNADAKPLNRAMMQWFFGQTVKSDADKDDPRFNIIGKADVANLPPTTIITAQIDPLHDDGTMLADKLMKAGVAVSAKDYPGVTHEFFGMGAVVAKARDAESVAAADLKKSFLIPIAGSPAPKG